MSLHNAASPLHIDSRKKENRVLSCQDLGEMAEPAEGARLLSECGAKVPPRVRIPLSPPYQYVRPPLPKGGLLFWRTDLSNRYKNRYNAVLKSVFWDCFDR